MDCVIAAGDPNTAYRHGAHRKAWERKHGPIPDGHIVHHRCGNKACVNPEHLEAMPQREHARLHMGRTHCQRGHSLDNAYVYPNGRRACRECRRAWEKAKRRR